MPVLLNQELSDFLSSSFHTDNLQFLMNQAAGILKNPVAVFDTNYSTVAYSDTSKVKDAEWLGGQKRGYCLYEYAASLHKAGMDIHDPAAFTILDTFGSRRRRLCPLIFNAEPIAYLSVLEYTVDFSEIPDEYYHIVQGVMTKELVVAHAIRVDTWHKSEDAILADLIGRSFANRMLYQQRIKGTAFEKNRNYQLVCIDMKDFTASNQHLKTFKEQLLDLFPYAWSVFMKRYAILLIASANEQICPPLVQDTADSLCAILEQYQIRGAVSDSFSDLYVIRQFYDEAVNALDLAISFKRKDTLVWYDSCKLLRAVSLIPQKESDQFYTKLVQDLLKSDMEKGTEYITTLMAYLEADRSLEVTGKKLSIHRNTVVYRINRMKELYGADFSDMYTNLQNYFGCLLVALAQ